MTVEAFLAWGRDGRWELVDGEPRAMAPPGPTHGIIQANVGYTLTRHLRDEGSTCLVVTQAAGVPRVRARSNMRVADVAVTCSPADAGQIALPDPVLIVEILSPTHERKTWENVWTYVSIPSVRDVLVLHSTSIAAELLRRTADGSWPEDPLALDRDALLRLESIGLICPLAESYTGTHLARAA